MACCCRSSTLGPTLGPLRRNPIVRAAREHPLEVHLCGAWSVAPAPFWRRHCDLWSVGSTRTEAPTTIRRTQGQHSQMFNGLVLGALLVLISSARWDDPSSGESGRYPGQGRFGDNGATEGTAGRTAKRSGWSSYLGHFLTQRLALSSITATAAEHMATWDRDLQRSLIFL